MPLPLRLHLNNVEYFQEGFSPTTHFNYTPISGENIIRWEYVADPYPKITDADFKFNMPILGQAVSDVYDALYGVPTSNGNPVNGGLRPFANEARGHLKEETWTALGQTNYKGLFYILSHIGLRGGPDGQEHYYLSSDWEADSSTFGHIDHRPTKITAISVNSTTGVWTFSIEAQQ